MALKMSLAVPDMVALQSSEHVSSGIRLFDGVEDVVGSARYDGTAEL